MSKEMYIELNTITHWIYRIQPIKMDLIIKRNCGRNPQVHKCVKTFFPKMKKSVKSKKEINQSK